MTQSRETALQLSIDALKSMVADYALRTKQAEELAGRLLMDADEKLKATIGEVITHQMSLRANDRAVHLQAVLNTSCLALNAALKIEGEEQRTMLIQILKDMTLASDNAQRVPKDSTKNRDTNSQ